MPGLCGGSEILLPFSSMLCHPVRPLWSLPLLLLLISVLLSTVAADQCGSQHGPSCSALSCPGSSKCVGCQSTYGLLQPSCTIDTSTAQLASGIIALIVIASLVFAGIMLTALVCCIRAVWFSERGWPMLRWGWQRSVVHGSSAPVAVYASAGQTVVMQSGSVGVPCMQMSSVPMQAQPQPVYAQSASMLQAQPVMYAQPAASYPSPPQYVLPQQSYAYQPQPVSYQPQPQQQQQWQ